MGLLCSKRKKKETQEIQSKSAKKVFSYNKIMDPEQFNKLQPKE